jgi:hypothetical protein
VFKLNDCLVTSEGGKGDITEELKNCTVKMAGQGRFFFQLNHCGPTAPVSKIDVHGICPAGTMIITIKSSFYSSPGNKEHQQSFYRPHLQW